MGLLDDVKSGKRKAGLKKEFKKILKNEEMKGLKHPHHTLALDSGKLQIKRPEGSTIDVENVQDEEDEDFFLPQEKGRVKTGIPGMDGVMEGGFRRNTVTLIGGGAGTGKSIFCLQFLIQGIKEYNETGVYISFEENENKILEDFKRFPWDLKDYIKRKKLVILYFTPEQVNRVVEEGGGMVRDVIDSINAKRLVIDSLTAFTLLFETPLEKRRGILQLFDALYKWGITVLVTSEQEPDPEKHKSTIIEFEVDGVILLYNVRKGDIRERSLEILKMRGTKHATKIFPMSIDEKGITIFPEETVF